MSLLDTATSALGAGATAASGVTQEDQSSVNAVEKAAKDSAFQWGGLFGLLGTGIENSDKIAGIFSDNYREDQIRLAQERNRGLFAGFNSPNQQGNNTTKYIIMGVIAMIIIVVIILIAKKK